MFVSQPSFIRSIGEGPVRHGLNQAAQLVFSTFESGVRSFSNLTGNKNQKPLANSTCHREPNQQEATPEHVPQPPPLPIEEQIGQLNLNRQVAQQSGNNIHQFLDLVATKGGRPFLVRQPTLLYKTEGGGKPPDLSQASGNAQADVGKGNFVDFNDRPRELNLDPR